MGCRGEALTQSRSDSGGILAYSSASLVSRDFARFLALHVQQLDHVFAVRSPLKRPASVRTCSMWFPVLFRFLAHSLTNVRSLGCGERCHLSHVIGDSAVVLSGMSRQIALQTLSEALRRTKRVLNAHQGMEGAKTLTEGFRRSGAPIPLTRGFQVARTASAPCKAHLHGIGSHAVGRWS